MSCAWTLLLELDIFQESGSTVQIGERQVYITGAGPKCVLWCHDVRGFNSGDR